MSWLIKGVEMENLECGNLVLTRRQGESIIIGDNITITLMKIESRPGGRAFISVQAPRNIEVHRTEIAERIREENGNI